MKWNKSSIRKMEGEPQIKIATGAREGEKQGKEKRETKKYWDWKTDRKTGRQQDRGIETGRDKKDAVNHIKWLRETDRQTDENNRKERDRKRR